MLHTALSRYNPKHTKYWLALAKIGIGYQTVRKLMVGFPDIETLWNARQGELEATGASPDLVRAFIQRRLSIDPERYARSVERDSTSIIDCDHSSYPPLLREIHSPPLALFVRGNVALLQSRCISVVGTRKPSPYGLRATQMVVGPLARSGITVVSGLAFGIDAEAHSATLDAQGSTIAILGSGVDRISPLSNASLGERILAAQGAIISEFPPGTEAQRHHFPQRNRVIAGMSGSTLVVEAGAHSGALITARFALEENRDVLAVPGPIDAETSLGTNELIRSGAIIAATPQRVLEAVGLDTNVPVTENAPMYPESETGTLLLRLLAEPKHVDELAAQSGLDAGSVNATISVLELHGRIRHLGGMHYIRNN